MIQLKTGHVALAFLAGAAAGAVTAYFTSPRSGKENREALTRSARELRVRAIDMTGQVQERLGRAARAAGEAFGNPSSGGNGPVLPPL
jgi:gas vesicle protein